MTRDLQMIVFLLTAFVQTWQTERVSTRQELRLNKDLVTHRTFQWCRFIDFTLRFLF